MRFNVFFKISKYFCYFFFLLTGNLGETDQNSEDFCETKTRLLSKVTFSSGSHLCSSGYRVNQNISTCIVLAIGWTITLALNQLLKGARKLFLVFREAELRKSLNTGCRSVLQTVTRKASLPRYPLPAHLSSCLIHLAHQLWATDNRARTTRTAWDRSPPVHPQMPH